MAARRQIGLAAFVWPRQRQPSGGWAEVPVMYVVQVGAQVGDTEALHIDHSLQSA